MGAHEVVDPAVERPIDAWRRVDGVRPLVIFEAVGVPGMIDQAMVMAPRGARILVVGVCMEDDRIRPMAGIGRELNLQFVLGYEPTEFAGALEALAEGTTRYPEIVTGTVDVAGVRRPSTTSATPRRTPRSSSSRRPGRPVVMADTFPRQYARTRRLTLGEPRSFVVSSDGTRVVFARSGAGDDPVNGLWVFDVDSGEEIHVVDAADLLADADAELPAQERARRERTREQASGIVSYATNADATMAAFALGGRLFTVNLLTGAAREIHAEGAVFDPRPDPTGTRVAYVSGRSLCVADLDGTTRIIEDPDPNVSWGSAEFVAAEEMDRYRGYWWAPEGDRVAACRVDISNVDRFHLADPADPSTQPTELAYPAAGTANADVVLAVISLDGDTKYLGWDRETYPYLVSVQWNQGQPLTFLVQSRDQRSTQVLVADGTTLATRVVSEDHDDAWVEIVQGSPAWAGDRLVTAGDRDGVRRVLVDGVPLTPSDLQVREIVTVEDDGVYVLANPVDEPTEQHVMQIGFDGTVTNITAEPGVHSAVGGGLTLVVRSSTLTTAPRTWVSRPGKADRGIGTNAERPLVEPQVQLTCVGPRKLWTALLLPRYREPGRKLPSCPIPTAACITRA